MIYEYQCVKCEIISEENRDVGERNAATVCPHCGGKVKKLVYTSGTNGNTGKGGRIPGLCRSLPGKPVYVKNKRHWKELCKQRSTESRQIVPLGLH